MSRDDCVSRHPNPLAEALRECNVVVGDIVPCHNDVATLINVEHLD